MINKRAIITVVSEISIGEKDVIEVTTPGEFCFDDEIVATYKETELSGMEGTTTVLKIRDNSVELLRIGTTESRMKFKLGEADVSLYKTPYGALEVTVVTNKLIVNVDENGGEIFIAYEMVIGDQPGYSTNLKVTIETK